MPMFIAGGVRPKHTSRHFLDVFVSQHGGESAGSMRPLGQVTCPLVLLRPPWRCFHCAFSDCMLLFLHCRLFSRHDQPEYMCCCQTLTVDKRKPHNIIKRCTAQIATTTSNPLQVSVQIKKQAQQEAEHFEGPVLEYGRMTTALKTALNKRHEKKITYMTAAHDLEAKRAHHSKMAGMGGDRQVTILHWLVACFCFLRVRGWHAFFKG